METDRVVIITGAAGGVGSVLVERFLANDDTVLASDTKQEVLDVWRPGFADLAAVVSQRHGRVDVLINCAGYFPVVSFEEMSVADWRTVIDVNLTGSFLTTRAVPPLMKDRGWGAS